jgi:hypothetical protein
MIFLNLALPERTCYEPLASTHPDRQGRSARDLGALAYSVGPHVVFASGLYQPRSPAGAGLLAHELAHVAGTRSRPAALRRKPDPARLNVVVPERVPSTPFTPGADYAWQNPVLRASVFPARESAFRQFLLEEKEAELRADLACGAEKDPDRRPKVHVS